MLKIFNSPLSVRLILVILLSVFCSITLAANKPSACGHHDYPPWNWKSGDKIVGVCAEITKVLFKKLAVDIDLSYVGPWKRCLKYIESGQVDVNICSFVNDQRALSAKFINTPVASIEQALFVRSDRQFPFNTLKDLNHKRIGLVLGVSIGQEFDNFIANNDVQVQRLSNYRQAFEMLKRGRIDAVPVGRSTGRALIKDLGLSHQITDLKTPLLEGKLYMSIAKSSPLIAKIPQLEALMQTPDYQSWVDSLLTKYSKKHQSESFEAN